jgi:alginate O-acetyltransferase complex protein AlgI
VLFNSLTFLVFFALVLPVFHFMPGWKNKKIFLLVASYVFYAAWNPVYVFILVFSTALDWWLARQLGNTIQPVARKALLIISLAGNLGLLAFFKYGPFILGTLQDAAGWLALSWKAPAWSIVLPVGISFYTFASLSYTIDVYRREIKSDTSLLDYALFVAFFPHLVAGPIVRARTLLPQIATPRAVTSDQVSYGLTLVVIGLFCKVVLADHLFAPVVDTAYAHPEATGSVGALAAIFGFAAQIYFDFGGYSLCAIGLALCFGFAFPDNFRYPYGAQGFSDFWRRWHISLSTWLRDYLYIPLGGNRFGGVTTSRNIMMTMLLGGLWHGASWMFVLWGALHGALLVMERWLRRRWVMPSSPLLPFMTATATFLLVCIAWVPFRAKNFPEMTGLASALGHGGLGDPQERLALVGALIMFGWHWWMRDMALDDILAKMPFGARAATTAMCLVGLFLASGGDERAFIYFQF